MIKATKFDLKMVSSKNKNNERVTPVYFSLELSLIGSILMQLFSAFLTQKQLFLVHFFNGSFRIVHHASFITACTMGKAKIMANFMQANFY